MRWMSPAQQSSLQMSALRPAGSGAYGSLGDFRWVQHRGACACRPPSWTSDKKMKGAVASKGSGQHHGQARSIMAVRAKGAGMRQGTDEGQVGALEPAGQRDCQREPVHAAQVPPAVPHDLPHAQEHAGGQHAEGVSRGPQHAWLSRILCA